ncbi:MBL fold metallo-hydrolase [Nocardia sp. 348MFTsu5.1]|uniref:MBL fold metallo-hydrolase n=1 Tax=Nocardia sp. 348MFTsu5.1 TaxID=1172185 RepID=UPI00037FAD4D|nr:MBL fold metallo-hydrolase [Nocardia sp. 348MFTsu5.1]
MAAVAAFELPPKVRVVAEGISVIPVDLPIKSLGYVLVYVIDGDDGMYLVDTGWDNEQSWQSLTSGLKELGRSVVDVRGVVATHIHPDHYGLAGRIRETSGAWIGLHNADAELVDADYLLPTDQQPDLVNELRAGGIPDSDLREVQGEELPDSGYVTRVVPDLDVSDGQLLPIPGRRVEALWTPGHSPGHLCFSIPDQAALVTGDHVLPRITPGVSVFSCAGADPLGDFLASLGRLDGVAADIVLPAHEYEFHGLEQRIAELIEHHRVRFEDVYALASSGKRTAWTIASMMRWSRRWDTIDSLMKRSAVGETLAHLIHLEKLEILQRSTDLPHRWSLSSRGHRTGRDDMLALLSKHGQ